VKSRRIPKKQLAEYRADALGMYEAGRGADEIARVLRCGRSTVFGWLAAARSEGGLVLEPVMPAGPVPKLSDRQVAELRALLCRDPRQLEFDFGLWTRAMVKELIARRFGVELSLSSTGHMLRHRMGMSPQKPLVRAAERDPEAVGRWKDEEYPAIRARARAEGAEIWFQDESGVRSDYHAGTTWAPIGQTPVITGTGKRFRVNMISAVNARGHLHFRLAEDRLNAEAFVEYLKALLNDVPGKIFLVVDGCSIHKAKTVKEYVASTGGRLELFFLPPYSPNLNPDEWVWKNIKHDTVGKTTVLDIHQLRAVIGRAVKRLTEFPEIVRGFFADSQLAYITTVQ
jgi:transposase